MSSTRCLQTKRMDTVRERISKAADRRGQTLKQLSLAVGKNHAYLQQFISRGVPRSLPEDVRRNLARMLEIDEDLLRHSGKGALVPSTTAKREDLQRIEGLSPMERIQYFVESSNRSLDEIRKEISHPSYLDESRMDLIIAGKIEPNSDELLDVSQLLEIPIELLTRSSFSAHTIPLVGCIEDVDRSRIASVKLYDEAILGVIQAPPDAFYHGWQAYEIQTTSMEPKYEYLDLIFVDPSLEAEPQDYLGHTCLVTLNSGIQLLRQYSWISTREELKQGPTPGSRYGISTISGQTLTPSQIKSVIPVLCSISSIVRQSSGPSSTKPT